jgi:ABC-type sulfate/molybdate transport systems ATPase subunit
MEHGRIQQVGNPQELYETPSSLFAMKFLGPVSVLQPEIGDPLYVRPHDLRIESFEFSGAQRGEICSIARRGPFVQLAVRLGNGSTIAADVSADRVIALQPQIGEHVYVGPTESRSQQFLQSA